MQLDFLRMPLLLERPMVVQNLVYDGENMASTLAIIRSRVATWPALVVITTIACVITLNTQNQIKYETGKDLWFGEYLHCNLDNPNIIELVVILNLSNYLIVTI